MLFFCFRLPGEPAPYGSVRMLRDLPGKYQRPVTSPACETRIVMFTLPRMVTYMLK